MIHSSKDADARLVIFVYVVYQSFSPAGFDETLDTSALMQNALTTLFVTNGVYAVLNLRDSPSTLRPHPAFWRLIHGCALFYFYILLLLTVLPPEKGKWMVRNIFPNANTSETTSSTTEPDGEKGSENDTLGNFNFL